MIKQTADRLAADIVGELDSGSLSPMIAAMDLMSLEISLYPCW